MRIGAQTLADGRGIWYNGTGAEEELKGALRELSMDRNGDLRGGLYRLMVREGYPAEFAALVAKEMNTDYLAKRMIAYVSRAGLIPPEEFADEMLAILEDRDRYMRKHLAEDAQAKVSDLFRYGLNTDDTGEE